ncbi:MAG: nucleoside hydrolase [Pseudomonadota bacterium]
MGVWIDADMGFDDVVAIEIVHNSSLTIDGLGLVVGNSTMDNVVRTAANASAALGWDFPITKGRTKSVLGRIDTAVDALGATGIRSAGREFPTQSDALPDDAFQRLCAYLEGEGPHRILALGPLTNIAALVLARPDLAARITDITWMGGSLTGGNITPHAEFNAYSDPEALAIVLAHDLPFRMVDLDFCRRVQVDHGFVPAVREAGGTHAHTLADYLSAYVDISLGQGHRGAAVYDAVAALSFIRDDLVSFASAQVTADISLGEKRGCTTANLSELVSNAEVAVDMDPETVKRLIVDAVVKAARR